MMENLVFNGIYYISVIFIIMVISLLINIYFPSFFFKEETPRKRQIREYYHNNVFVGLLLTIVVLGSITVFGPVRTPLLGGGVIVFESRISSNGATNSDIVKVFIPSGKAIERTKDMDGEPVMEEDHFTVYTIRCESKGVKIESSKCWNTLKNKSKAELISLSSKTDMETVTFNR